MFQAHIAKKKVAELKDRLMKHLGNMKPALYNFETEAGWPGHFEGKQRGMYSTGWCNATY